MRAEPISVADYFEEHTPSEYRLTFLRHSVNALIRGGIKTMEKLMDISAEELIKLRNIGSKNLRLIMLLRNQFIDETGQNSTRKL